MVTRREFLKASAVFGAGLFLPWGRGGFRFLTQSTKTPLDPTTIGKYRTALAIPPVMPRVSEITGANGELVDYYEVIAQQFSQQILPSTFPKTTVFGYAAQGHPETQSTPSFTIEATIDKPVRVKWINGLVDGSGAPLQHIIPIDPTLHWANPSGEGGGRDVRPTFASTPGVYTGAVPVVTHLHGAHVDQESDGYPAAWFLPNSSAIPSSFFKTGSFYDGMKALAENRNGQNWEAGSSVYQYRNDQRATELWFHDHTLGMTHVNVYAGLAGLYNLRGGSDDLPAGVLPGPAPQRGDPTGTRYYEIPLLIQDRSFNTDGSFFYPDTRAYFPDDPFPGPYIPDSDISPIWNPEFFGNAIMVNGNTWPALDIEPRRYRFRFLNGCDTRFLILQFATQPVTRPTAATLPFYQIGSDGGFLAKPVQLETLLLAPAERADVIVDFTGIPEGTKLYLINVGPDAPFNGDPPMPADPNTTGQVMKLTVVPLNGTDPSTPPSQLTLPSRTPLGKEIRSRQVSINEEDSVSQAPHGPIGAMLGTLNQDGTGNPIHWMDDPTEMPIVGNTEIWEIYNFTDDAHPIHLHLVEFEVVNRESFNNGAVRPPEDWESGTKDMVIAYPKEITRIKAKFDLAGRYVWHCHILEHEDNEMMRPYEVLSAGQSGTHVVNLPFITR